MPKALYVGSKGLNSPMGDTNSPRPTPTDETLKQDTQHSAQPDRQHPYTPKEVKEAMGFDPDDPNVEVIFEGMERLSEGLDRIFGTLGVTAPVTGDPGDPLGTDTMDDPENLAVEAGAGICEDILDELQRAVLKHPEPFNSPHEGYAVIKEEFDELWELIKVDRGYGSAARKEAIQVAAMALRYLLDIDPE